MNEAAFKKITGKTFAQELLEGLLEARRNAMPQVDALLAAGWAFELPEIVNNWPKTETEPWQWYWRRPARRAGGRGRRYQSTTQAFNALTKERR